MKQRAEERNDDTMTQLTNECIASLTRMSLIQSERERQVGSLKAVCMRMPLRGGICMYLMVFGCTCLCLSMRWCSCLCTRIPVHTQSVLHMP